MVVEFRYSNRDRDKDYKCKYVVTIPGGKDGKPFGVNELLARMRAVWRRSGAAPPAAPAS